MLITYKNIHDPRYPVFVLPNSNWSLQDGLLFLDDVVLDDKNMPGETLGIRRLQTPFKEIVPLKYSIPDPVGLIKHSSYTPYIDFNGKIFLYEKTKWARLQYFKIKKVDKQITHCLLWIARYNSPFVIPRPPPPGYNWAGVITINNFPWMLFDYSKERRKTSRKKI